MSKTRYEEYRVEFIQRKNEFLSFVYLPFSVYAVSAAQRRQYDGGITLAACFINVIQVVF